MVQVPVEDSPAARWLGKWLSASMWLPKPMKANHGWSRKNKKVWTKGMGEELLHRKLLVGRGVKSG